MNTLNLSTFNSFQQILLFILIILGSAIWVSIATVHVRIRAFEPKLQELADRRRKKRLPIARTFYSAVSKTFSKAKRSSGDEREDAIASGAVRGRAIITSEESSRDDISSGPRRHIKFEEPSERTNGDENIVREVNEELSPPTTVFEPSPASTNGYPNSGTPPTVQGKDLYDGDPAYLSAPSQPEKVQIIESPHPRNQDGDSIVLTPSFRRTHKRVFTGGGVGARSNLYNHPRNAAPIIPVADNIDDEEKGEMKRHDSLAFLDKYLKGFNGLVGRNSQFHGLTEKERRELGGLEYDALIFLSYLVPMYFILFQLIGAIAMGAWFHVNMPEVTRQNGLNPFWTGTFFAIVSGKTYPSIHSSDQFAECL